MLTDDLNAGFGGLISRKDRAAELIKDRRVKRDTYRDDEQVRAEAEVVALADAMSRKDAGSTLFISNTGVLEGIFEAAGSGPCPH